MAEPIERAVELARFAKEVQAEMQARRGILDAAQALLVAHQRLDAGGCVCGWAKLGASHPAHQVQVLEEAGLLAAAAPQVDSE